MITIKLENNIDKEIDDIIDNEFNKFAKMELYVTMSHLLLLQEKMSILLEY